MCVRACVCIYLYARVCVRVRVCSYVFASMRPRVCVRVSVCVGWWIGVAVTSRLVARLGGVAVGSILGCTLADCGGGKSLCLRPVYGRWCAHSFNKPSPSVRQR